MAMSQRRTKPDLVVLQNRRWVAIAILGNALELTIFGIIVRVFYQLQRKGTKKLKGLIIFALRLPLFMNPRSSGKR